MRHTATVLIGFLGALLLTGSIVLAFDNLNSDTDVASLIVLIVFPVVFLTAGLSLHASSRAIRRGTLTVKMTILYYVALTLIPPMVYEMVLFYLIPSNIKCEFSYPGNTGTYQAVQFYFKHDGRWLGGPSVEGLPLTVSFPDLNGDGYPDIRVTENEGSGSVEFVYLPQNDGHTFWRAIKNDTRLSAAYYP